MEQELAVVVKDDLVANTIIDLPVMQAGVFQWSQEKLEQAKQEYSDLDTACAEAKRKKWNTKALAKAAKSALKRLTFYEKVHAALEEGYMLFPPVPNADVIAIRTGKAYGKYQTINTPAYYSSPAPLQEIISEALPLGEGEYKSPYTGWALLGAFKDDKGNDKKSWESVTELQDAEFPLVMAKPQIVKATNAAMEMKIFDEIRLFPFIKKKGDPCILGVILNPETKKRNYFLISWRINKEDL